MTDLSFFELLAYFPAGFASVFSPDVFGWMLLGIFIGFFIGLLPGLGGPAALALIIPFTYQLDPFGAFGLLLGLISVAMTAGDITAILFGIPGVPESAATIIDGHALAKRGQAGRALGASLSASLIGAVFGALMLAVAVVIMRPLVLSIGYAEFFMLSLAGISFLASLSSVAVFKGLAIGAFGIALSMIGLDPVTSVERYTFDSLFLWDGIGFVPAVLGLFAIPELIDMAQGKTRINPASAGKISNAFEGVKDTFRNIWLVLRCSAISTYIGIIPGMGASIAQWVAYGHAVQTARDREGVGKGAVEGIIGPGAANNATMSGGLIPTIGFGVPGSPQNAILLGAFIIHGLVPGPAMLRPEAAGGHLTLTFAMVAMIITSNVIVVFGSLMFLNHIAKIAYIRSHLLIPFIIALLFVGSFAAKFSLYDLAVTLLFGLLGWAMERLDWPRPPLILGLVLGALIENNLFLAISSDGYSWMLRPSVVVIFTLILGSIGYPFYKRSRRIRQRGSAQPQFEANTESKPGSPGEEVGNLTLAIAILAVFAYAIAASYGWPFQSRLIPISVSIVGGCFVLIQAATHLRRMFIVRREILDLTAIMPKFEAGARAGVFIWSVLLGSLGLIHLLGFIGAIPIILFTYLKFRGSLSLWWTLVVVGIACFTMYYLFINAVKMPVPVGALVEFIIQRAPELSPYLSWMGV